MTKNNKIAEVMGWKSFQQKDLGLCWMDDEGNHMGSDKYLTENIFTGKDRLWGCFIAKLLQARMVADKNMIKIINNYDGKYLAESVLSCRNSILSDWCNTESAAIVALFVKVYGIENEKD